jgi:two-component system response regulator AtoC
LTVDVASLRSDFEFRIFSMSPTILIVDDERHTREGLRAALEDRFDVYVAGDIPGAISVLENDTIDLMVTDLRLGAEDGMQLIDRALRLPHPPICIMMTAYGSVDTAVEAMKHGAYDFVTKPINIDRLEILIQRALKSRETETENRELKQQVEKHYGLENIIGNSGLMQEVFDTVRQIAPTRATVLIEGESGTGKELIAHAIHNLSNRNRSKFIAVHCAALSSNLLESELFGHEKGAFSGAISQRIGRLELAHMGTLFLDEIGDLPLELQPKLLRALQEKEIERLGGRRTIPVDVRLIAATNRNLTAMVKTGEFRSDLYYRLKVFPLTLPPLRARSSDIPLLVNYFVHKHARRMNRPITTIPKETMAALIAWPWPGNVRELENFIERAVILTPGSVLRAPLAELERVEEQGGAPLIADFHTAEREHILRVIREAKGMIGGPGGAAERLGLKRTTLNSKLKKLGIERSDYA